MPRGKKRANRDKDRDIARYWSAMIQKGLDARKGYTAAAKTVEQYLGPTHKELFERDDVRTHFMRLDGANAVSVPKIAQMRNTLGPRLYQVKPVRSLHSMTNDLVMIALGIVLEEYINYTVREANLAKQQRKSIDDALVRGRGFLKQEFEPEREIVTSKYVSSLDVVFDPDFLDIEDAKWIAYRVVEPFWETKRRITEKWRIKGLGERHSNIESDTHAAAQNEHRDGGKRKASSAELNTYWVVLSKMGRGLRGLGQEKNRSGDEEDFVRLEIVVDHEYPIAEGEWDVPLYLDKGWPLSYVDLVEAIDKHWPDSISSQVLPSQQAIDLLSSVRLQASKNRDRLMVFMDLSMMDKKNVHRFKNGGAADLIGVELPPGKSLTDSLFVPNFGEGSQSAELERQFHERQIETTTGVTDAISGGQEPIARERSATASQIRSDAANARIMDLRQKVEEFTSDAARKEAIITRLTLDSDDVMPVVPAEKINMWYVRVEVAGGVPLPVRDTRPEDVRQANPKGGPLTLERISPQASTFFITPEEAFGAASDLFDEMLETEDPQVIALVNQIMDQGMNPETQLPESISIDIVTAETVWEATAGLTPKELMREFSYEMATGSGHKLDKMAEQQNADFLVQNVLSVALQNGDIENANKILSIRDEAFDIPMDQRVQLSPPPPPMPEEGPPPNA